LSEIQMRIDSYQQQLMNMDRQTDYSTITLTMTEKKDLASAFTEMTGIKELIRNVGHEVVSEPVGAEAVLSLLTDKIDGGFMDKVGPQLNKANKVGPQKQLKAKQQDTKAASKPSSQA